MHEHLHRRPRARKRPLDPDRLFDHDVTTSRQSKLQLDPRRSLPRGRPQLLERVELDVEHRRVVFERSDEAVLLEQRPVERAPEVRLRELAPAKVFVVSELVTAIAIRDPMAKRCPCFDASETEPRPLLC